MKNTILATAIALAALVMPATASAETEFYAETGGWTIFKGNGSCHMIASYESDAILSVYVEDMSSAGFWLQNPAWKSIKDGSRYTLQIEFDDYGEWDMPAVGRGDEDGPGVAWIGNIQPNAQENTFMGEFMVATGMRVSINGREIGRYSMEDTRAASMTLSSCLRNAHATADPFEGLGGTSEPEDPFVGI